MSIAIYEGVIEQGQVRFNEKVALPESTRLYVIVPVIEESERQYLSVTRSLNSLNFYRDKTFETFELPLHGLTQSEQGCLEEAYKLAKTFANDPADWLLFSGGHGVGKTHLAAAIANHQKTIGSHALFVFVPDMLDHLRSTFDRSSNASFEQIFEEVRTAPLLVLDDLGTESATPWAREKLYQIINHRYVAKLPTVITTSVSPDDLDPRIRTRILDETRCLVFPIIAPSYRGGHDNRPALPRPARTTRSKR